MPENPLTLSIVIPAYNEERYIGACLDSIASQTVKPDEVIVVDNNSTDRTAEIARSYSFASVFHEKQQGIVFARNRGFEAVTSEIIGRIDADVVLHKTWVEEVCRLYQQAGQPKLWAVNGPSTFRNKFGGIWYGLHRVFYFWASRIWMGTATLSGSNMAFTRNTWQLVRKEVCIRTDIHEDMDLAFHLHKRSVPIVFSRLIKDSMLNRNYLFKLRYYIPMFWRVKFMKH